MQYAMIGAGRVGAGMTAFLRDLGHQVAVVTRAQSEGRTDEARAALAAADIVAIAIPDSAIGAVRSAWADVLDDRSVIHFSGALEIEGAWSAHPLYSCPREPLAPDVMAGIAFALDEAAPPLEALFPGAANPWFRVPAERRGLYHALAVLSGNFSAFVWNEVAQTFQAEFPDAPPGALAFYLRGVVDRFEESPTGSMTGPVARRDALSVRANLSALAGAPRLEALYKAFLAEAWPDFRGPR